jgi:hypothetical protein
MTPETSSINEAVEMVVDPVLTAGDACEHVMALHLDPQGDGNLGVVRCIVDRTGDVSISGYVDRSRIHVVEMESPFEGHQGPQLDLAGSDAVISRLAGDERHDFLGLEDPNVWREPESGVLHLYCSIPLIEHYSGDLELYLGHAEGEDVYSLTMTDPVLGPVVDGHGGAKEVAIAPKASDGRRYNLVESSLAGDGLDFSVLRTAVAADLRGPWKYGGLQLHPGRDGYQWCNGHLSPGPFLPKSFLDVGENRVVGLLNGREESRLVDGRTVYGEFSVGLLIYDYEHGEIEWFSEEPFLRDPEAETITFASAFRQPADDGGVIYAHVDDSFVRAYLVDPDSLRSFLP